jgi:hypothetical protein
MDLERSLLRQGRGGLALQTNRFKGKFHIIENIFRQQVCREA